MPRKVAIIDSGGANIASVSFALERLGIAATLTRDAATIQSADRVLLPGVGAARDSMDRLRDAGLPGLAFVAADLVLESLTEFSLEQVERSASSR